MSKPHVTVKICGLTDEEAVSAAVEAGADMLGFVFFEKSPRNLSVERAVELLDFLDPENPDEELPANVGLVVDAEDRLLYDLRNNVRLDYFQLHGHETPERVDEIRQEWGLPVIKAVSVAEAADLVLARELADAADWVLFDAKPPKGAERPGGNAASFDWTILKGLALPVPWMLAGGLSPETVAEALKVSGARAVDVSSGVESAPGVKDPAKIAAFIAKVRQL